MTSKEKILAALETGPKSSSAIAQVVGIGVVNCCSALLSLLKAGKVKREGARKHYVYTLQSAD